MLFVFFVINWFLYEEIHMKGIYLAYQYQRMASPQGENLCSSIHHKEAGKYTSQAFVVVVIPSFSQTFS